MSLLATSYAIFTNQPALFKDTSSGHNAVNGVHFVLQEIKLSFPDNLKGSQMREHNYLSEEL